MATTSSCLSDSNGSDGSTRYFENKGNTNKKELVDCVSDSDDDDVERGYEVDDDKETGYKKDDDKVRGRVVNDDDKERSRSRLTKSGNFTSIARYRYRLTDDISVHF